MKALSIVGARIIDPASGYDGEGVITIEEGRITAIGADAHPQGGVCRSYMTAPRIFLNKQN